jgi:hypothetical protein
MGVSDYLKQIQQLTDTNLKLLKALNEVFYTDQNHLSVDLGDEGRFVIPSFVSLENKINTLQSNFDNLVNAPATNEAHFTFNGDSRAIEVKRYEQAPAPLVLDNQTRFFHEDNDILKDFLTPVPYLKFNLANIPYDINTVIVRKVAALSETAKSRFMTLLGYAATVSINWGDVNKMLEDLVEDVDYSLYDTAQKLPVRTGQGSGSYVLREILEEYIDDNLDQHISIRLANDIDGFQKTLSYLLFDQTIERDLTVGDYLVNWDGHAKFEIEDLNFNTNTLKLKVCYGDYSNLYPCTDTVLNPSQISDVSKLRFFSNATLFDDTNVAKVPLEEDQYVFVAIAPLNDRMNIRATWGDGILVNTDKLMTSVTTPDGSEDVNFREYYKNCRNIGDILNEISKVMSNTTSSHTNSELNYFMSAKPEIDTDIMKVIYINRHLDDTPTIKNIRALYAQKNSYSAALTEAQNSLSVLENTLSTIDFQDTTGVREQTQNQIDETTKRKNELISSLVKISNEIALAANNSVVPIEDPKYRIRGFFDFVDFANTLAQDDHNISPDNIKGILVQYRYRNVQQESGTAQTFVKDSNGNGIVDDEDKTFIFSDWNQLNTFLRPRIRTADGKYIAEPDNSNKNLPSFNQVDIPITQGETVDVRLRVIYDFGYPFIQMMSDWSDIVTFEFPVEFIKDVSIVSIIEENNNDIETNRFKSILSENGINEHVEDKVLDQDVTFFHKPENISSGFYTAERRIIPLRDKLKTMDDEITRISDEISGEAAEQLQVSVDFDESSIVISPYEVGKVILKSYDTFTAGTSGSVGNYEFDGTVASLLCNIRLTNTSNHSLKIFPMFIGTDDTVIGPSLINNKFNTQEFYGSEGGATASDSAVWVSQIVSGSRSLKAQTTNQIITFRTQNPWDGTYYYKYSYPSSSAAGAQLPAKASDIALPTESVDGMTAYPYLIKQDGLKMSFKDTSKYMVMNASDEIVVPVMVQYKFKGTGSQMKKTISFDVRTSLYSDPLTYTFDIEAHKNVVIEDKLVSSLTKQFNNKLIKNRRYISIVK